mgnify:CR=1 FL=1
MDGALLRTLHCYGCGRDLPETAFARDVSIAKARGRAYHCLRCKQDAFPVGIEIAASYELIAEGYTPADIDNHNRALALMIQHMRCNKCGAQGKAVLSRLIDSSERSLVRAWCLSCFSVGDRNFSYADIKKRGIILDLIPVYSRAESHVCAVEGCNRTDTQLHHWLPRHKVADYDLPARFPQSYLCPEHHALWHKLVTPEMSKGNGEVELP